MTRNELLAALREGRGHFHQTHSARETRWGRAQYWVAISGHPNGTARLICGTERCLDMGRGVESAPDTCYDEVSKTKGSAPERSTSTITPLPFGPSSSTSEGAPEGSIAL